MREKERAGEKVSERKRKMGREKEQGRKGRKQKWRRKRERERKGKEMIIKY